MKLKEIKGDIFEHPRECYTNPVCADFTPAYSINNEYEKRFGTMSQLIKTWKTYKKWYRKDGAGAIVTHNPLVMNLVIKEEYFQVPSYKSIDIALGQAADMCYGLDIFELSMPMIGTIDGLDWEKVKAIIEKRFEDLNMLISVYY